MNTERTLIASITFLAIGLGLIVGYCHGTVGVNAAYPVAGAGLSISINTNGLPAVLGTASTLLGLLLLIVALIQAIMGQVRWPGESTKPQTHPISS